MNKRQRKKINKQYAYGTLRKGCEYCFGISNRLFKTMDAMLWGISLKLDKKKMWIRENKEDICYIDVRYCWNCGRKLK